MSLLEEIQQLRTDLQLAAKGYHELWHKFELLESEVIELRAIVGTPRPAGNLAPVQEPPEPLGSLRGLK